MSIGLQSFTLIIPKATIAKKYIGGYETFIREIKFREEDNELVSVLFMSNDDVDSFCDELAQKGFDFSNTFSNDFVVISTFLGYLWKVDWIERDKYHCWYKGVLPTHTNEFTPIFKEHKILDESKEYCIWWNNLNDIWKNIFYQNYIENGENKIKRLHNKFPNGYKLKFVGALKEEDILKMLDLEIIWLDAYGSNELDNFENLLPLENFKKLKRLTFRASSLIDLSGIEKLSSLGFIELY